MKRGEIRQNGIDGLLSCLQAIPFVQVEAVEQELNTEAGRPDFVVKLRLRRDGRMVLIGECKNSGQPRLIRDAANALYRYRDLYENAYGVVVAPFVSQDAARLCAEEGLGYADLAGNCRLSFGNVYVERAGKPNRYPEKRDLRSLYSPKAERVLRALLSDPARRWRLQDLANQARVSLGQVHNVKKLLSDREWLRVDRDGAWLAKPDSLLSEWAANYSYRRNVVHELYSLRSTSEIEYDVAEACAKRGLGCALTGFSAAARIAPFVRYQRAVAYVDGDLTGVVADLGLKPVASGANVLLFTPYDDAVFYGANEYDGVPVASAIQTYLDLGRLHGRGDEAAEFLKREVIDPAWVAGESTTGQRR